MNPAIVLAAARLMLENEARLSGLLHGVYTFGQPAVGNADFADEWAPQLGQLLHRHIYARDVVPHLPPTWFGRFVRS